MEEMKGYPRPGYEGREQDSAPAGFSTRSYKAIVRTAPPSLPGDALGVRGGGGEQGNPNREAEAPRSHQDGLGNRQKNAPP